jgi:hypothetical protein
VVWLLGLTTVTVKPLKPSVAVCRASGMPTWSITVCPTPTGFGIAPMYAAVDLADAAFADKNDRGNVSAIINPTVTIMFIFRFIFPFLRVLSRKISKIFLDSIVYVSNLYIKSIFGYSA